jgi:cell division protease FtsH
MCWTTRCCARAGFDRQIMVELPARRARRHPQDPHQAHQAGPDVELHRIARGTPGFSGADLSNLVNEAALLAARRGAEAVELKDLEEARDKVRWGRERRSRMLDDHGEAADRLPRGGARHRARPGGGGEPLHKVTIIPRGQSLGPRCSCRRRTATRRASAS